MGIETDCQDQDMRVIIKTQRDLWNDGVRAGMILGDVDLDPLAEEYENDHDPERRADLSSPAEPAKHGKENGDYHAGKWGRYVRAPDIYFEIMRRFGNRFVALGEIANIRFGVKSGCDAFFMPRDVTAQLLAKHESDRAFRRTRGRRTAQRRRIGQAQNHRGR